MRAILASDGAGARPIHEQRWSGVGSRDGYLACPRLQGIYCLRPFKRQAGKPISWTPADG